MATLDVSPNVPLAVQQTHVVSKANKPTAIKLCDFKSFLKMDTSALDPGQKFALAQNRGSQPTDKYTELSLHREIKEEDNVLVCGPKVGTLPQITVSAAPEEHLLQYISQPGLYGNVPGAEGTFGTNSFPVSPIPGLKGQLVPRSPVLRNSTPVQTYSPCTSESQYSINTNGTEEECLSGQDDERDLADVAIEKSLHEISMRDAAGLKESDSLNVTLKSGRDTSFSDDQIVPHLLAEDFPGVVTTSPQHLHGNLQQFHTQYTHTEDVKADFRDNMLTMSNVELGKNIGMPPMAVLDSNVLKQLLEKNKEGSDSQTVSQASSLNQKMVIQGTIQEKLSKTSAVGRHSCNICGAEFKLHQNLSRHMMNVHNKSTVPFKCEDCNEEFRNPVKLQKHKKAKHQAGVDSSDSKETVVCPICGIEYSSTYYRRVHQKFHNGIRYACQICGRAFTHPQNMWRHYKLHEGPENYKYACHLCGLPCKSELTLRRHIDAKHKDSQTTTSSDIENQPGFLKRETSFNCSICSKEFATKQALYCHLRVHNKNKPIKEYDLSCGVCHKAYKVWGALRKHCNTMHNGMGLVENELKSTGDVDYPYVVVHQQNKQAQTMDVDVADALKSVSGEKNKEALIPNDNILHEFVRIATADESDAVDVKDSSGLLGGFNAKERIDTSKSAAVGFIKSQSYSEQAENISMDIDEHYQSSYQTQVTPPANLLQEVPAVHHNGGATSTESATQAWVKENNSLLISGSSDQTAMLTDEMAPVIQDVGELQNFLKTNPLLYNALGNHSTNSNENLYANTQIGVECNEPTQLGQPFSQIQNSLVSTGASISTDVAYEQNVSVTHPMEHGSYHASAVTLDMTRRYGRPKGSKNKKRLVKDGKTYFQCEYCDELFLSRPGINNHLKSHRELQNYGKIPTSRVVRKMVRNAQREQLAKDQTSMVQQPNSQLQSEHTDSGVTEPAKINVSAVTAGLGAVINQYAQTFTKNSQLQNGDSSNIQATLLNIMTQIVKKQTDGSLASQQNSNNLTVPTNPPPMKSASSSEVMSPIEEAFRIATAEGPEQDFLCASTPISMINDSFDCSTVVSDEGYNSTEIGEAISEVYAENVGDSHNKNIIVSSGHNLHKDIVNDLRVNNHPHIQSNLKLSGEAIAPVSSVQSSLLSLSTSTNVQEKDSSQDLQQTRHSEVVKHQCPHCDAVFKKTAVLQKHIALHIKHFASQSQQM